MPASPYSNPKGLKGKDNPLDEPSPDSDRRRVDALEAKLRAARERNPKPQSADGPSSGMSHRQTGVAYRVLVDMIAGLLVGGFLGYWLDRWFDWAPYALIAGLVVGFAAGVNNAWRAIRVYSEDVEKGEGKRLP
jgi:ATP synthase protein I